MATGETRTIDSDLTLTSELQMTKYDDILNIIGATVTLSKPAGDIFTDAGNDTITITNAAIQATAPDLSFMLGSGDDTLTLQSSTVSAPILAGSGNDTVIISGDAQSEVTLKTTPDAEAYTLSLGGNDDVLEIRSVLEGDGSISFGTGTDTLRFNGGSLLTTGELGTFSILDVTNTGGTLGRDLVLAGENTQISLNGTLLGSSSGKCIAISDSTTTLTAADNIQTNVMLNFANVTLTQSDGGSLKFADHTGYAITANNSTVALHNIVTESGQVLAGTDTVWKIKDSNFTNSTTGIDLTGGMIDLNNVEMSNYTGTAMKLSGTKFTGAQLAFFDNIGNGAISAQNAEMAIEDVRINGNKKYSAITSSAIASSAQASALAMGGAICHMSGKLILTSADLSGNIADGRAYATASVLTSATAYASAYAAAYAYQTNYDYDSDYASSRPCNVASSIGAATAMGGAICHSSDELIIASANFFGNIAKASASASSTASAFAHAYASAYAYASAPYSDWRCASATANASAYARATASAPASGLAKAMGGAICHSSGNMTIGTANFSGNIVQATARATSWVKAYATGSRTQNAVTDGCKSSAKAYAYAAYDAYACTPAPAIGSANAQGGAICHFSGDLSITSANFSDNVARVSATVSASASASTDMVSALSPAIGSANAQGGAIYYSSGNLTITTACFSGNVATATSTASAITNEVPAIPIATAIGNACGGGGYITAANSNFTDTNFVCNKAEASSSAVALSSASAITSAESYGGALYLSNSTMTYTVTSGTEISNTGNQAQYGGFLYMADNSTANFVVEDKAVLTIGDNTNNDSIAGTGLIEKRGTGYLLINSDVSGYTGLWTVYEGTLELARISRTIKLDNWIFGENGTLVLSSQNDIVNMTIDKTISTLDLGGGSDIINTNGHSLSDGVLRISKLKFTGGGEVSSTITTRTADAGFDLTLDDVVLNSNITGGNAVDKITITKSSTLGGLINLGNGENLITATAEASFKRSLIVGDGNDTLNFTNVNFEDDVNLGEGDNQLIATGTASFGKTLVAGAGADGLSFDSVTLTGAADLGGGNNTMTAGTANIQGSFKVGSGDDTLSFTNVTFGNTVNLGDGSNSLTATTADFKEFVTLGTGNDTLIFGKSSDYSGSVIAAKTIDLGDGDNSITAYGTAEFTGIVGGNGSDTVDLYKISTIRGELDLGDGENVVYVEDTLTMTNGAVKMTEGGETRIIVYRGTTLTDNTLTVYADASAERETATYSWANQTDLNKVRLLVSSDSTFETFEFAVELYNKSKSFTLNMEKGYFVQFQANNEDGWEQRLVDDYIAPNQVTGVEFDGKALTWDVTRDNLGGNGVKQYTVEVAIDSSFTALVDTRTVTETEYIPTGLDDGTYYFRVCAEDYTQNIGEWSSTVTGIFDTTPPTNPSQLTVTVDNQDAILSWTASVDTQSGVAGYTIYYSLGSEVYSVTTADTSYTLTDLAAGTWSWSVFATDNAGNKSGTVIGDDFEIKEEVQYIAKSDVDGNTISDVMFQYTGGDYQIGFWMNGTSTWQGTAASQPDTWELLGSYDMDQNGKADQVMVGNVEVSGVNGAYIGYYKDGDTTANGWQNIGYLSNSEDITWNNAIGNLTGNAGANSIVWHAAELGACGVWTDGTDNWVSLGSGFDSTWTMQGCGDFTGDGKDEVLFSHDGNLYSTNIDQTFAALGQGITGWEVRAIGDFSGDGQDDIVLFHKETGSVMKFENGTTYQSLGQLDASDWFICGAGDYNGDEQDDLLVRQYSTGMLGYYESGDMSKWVEMGRGVDMNWTVIA